jgi:C_GCAxxG_C_C family probable redox protein
MLAVGGHVLGGPDRQLVRATTGFSGGVGSTKHQMCGALSSGVMVIGAVHGRSDLSEDGQLARELAERYRARFVAELGSAHCQTLYDAVHAPLGQGACSALVERAARILLDVLDEGGGEECSPGEVME